MSKKTAPKTAPEQAEMAELDPMNALALRIWNGQSVSLSLRERVERIKKGLIEQGFEDNLGALKLPVEGFERFL